MNILSRIVIGILFLVVVYLVSANEDVSDSLLPLSETTNSAEELTIPSTSTITGETILDANNQSEPSFQDTPSPQEPSENNTQQTILTQESIPLQPTLPSEKQKPPISNAITGKEFGETWDKICSGSICTHTLYPFQTYYFSNNLWQPIDENFYTTNCRTNYDACVTNNLYQVHIKSYANQSDAIYFSRDNSFIIFEPQQIHFKQLTNSRTQTIAKTRQSAAQVANNNLHYPASFGTGIDLQFQYLPRMWKEEIILQTNSSLPAAILTTNRKDLTLDVEFKLQLPVTANLILDGALWNKQTPATTQNMIQITDAPASFYLAPPLVYDAKQRITQASYILENRGNGFYLTISVPYHWLMNETRMYPVVIDPTITLDDTEILWDGNVNYESEVFCPEGEPCNNPWRISTLQNISIGDKSNWPSLGSVYGRGNIDWNLSSLPNHAQIATAELILYGEQAGVMNGDIRFYHMHGGNTHYPNNFSGNTGFYNDIANGTQYLNQTFLLGENRFNLSKHPQLKIDFENLLKNNTDVWSIGFKSNESGHADAKPNVFTSSEGANASRRPQLKLVYTSSKPSIQILTPANNSIFSKIGGITITANITDADNDLLTVSLFGSNVSQPSAEDLLYRKTNLSSGSIISYNWTSPAATATSQTVLLFHFDKREEQGETNIFFSDSSSAKNNGFCVLGKCPSFIETGGKIASAFQFDGIDDYVNLSQSSSLNVVQNITMAAWIKTTAGIGFIVGGYSNTTPFEGYGLGLGGVTPGKISYWSGAHGGWTEGNTSVNNGQWQHVAVSVAGNNAVFYVNGIVDNVANSSIPNSYVGRRAIGASSDGSVPWNGTLDEVLIFNRSLTQEEIMNLYRIQSGKYSFWINVTDGIEDAQSETREFTLYADEFEGEISIEKAIQSLLGLSAPLFRDIQIYTRNQANTHELGRFDRNTASATKRWGFNYITEGESFTNMKNISITIYFSEMINLTGAEIQQRVTALINATM